MGWRETRPRLAAATISVSLALLIGPAAAVACENPGAAGYGVEFPQGDHAPIKLYETNKGGRIGSVQPAQVKGQLELCSDKVGSVNQVRLPKGIAIDLEDGKTATSSGQYWVRSNQIRFESRSADNDKQFACERNQVKTRVAGGAAGAESCK